MRNIIRNIYLNISGIFKKPASGIHIINGHVVSKKKITKGDNLVFENFLRYLNKRCQLINIQDATQLIVEKKFSQKEALVAFTFDDGFEECHSILAPLLENYKILGAFFINSNYIDCDENYRKRFNNRTYTYTKKPMSWGQVRDLHTRGHVIGSHTLDHLNISELSESEIAYQLSKNKKILEEKLEYNCEYFAWPYGQLLHFPRLALQQTLKYHKYIFSSANYKRYFSFHNQVINRRHMEAFWPENHINYFLSVKKSFVE